MKLKIITVTLVILFISSVAIAQEFEYSEIFPLPETGFIEQVLNGLDVLEELSFQPLYGKTIVVLTNHTSVSRKGVHLLDLLAQYQDSISIRIVYTPEHGLFSPSDDMVSLPSEGKDPRFNAQIKYLWERRFRPDILDLYGVDLILIDIQDPGLRYFSYITTVTKMMEAGAIAEVPVMVLDRPNPFGGIKIEGPMVRPKHQSFVGYHLVPIRHGLTVGEYALMINETGWVRQSERVRLTVVPMIGWERETTFSETELPWIPPAPGIPDWETLRVYEGMALFNGTNISVGIGTDQPYFLVGAPWVLGSTVLGLLERSRLPGVQFEAGKFTPDSLNAYLPSPIYRGEECDGIRMIVTDWNTFEPLRTAATILSIVSSNYPTQFRWTGSFYVDKLYGHDYLRIFLAQRRDTAKLPATWTHDVIRFSQFREKFLLY